MAAAAEANFFQHLLPVGSQSQTQQGSPMTGVIGVEAANKRPRIEGAGKGNGKDKRTHKPPKGQGRSGQPSRQDGPDIQKLTEATAKLALRLADANQLVMQDCGFTWFVSREEGSILPVMFGVSAEWRRIKETTPDKISRPLFSIMMECILKELVARVQQADQDENLRKAAKTALWVNSDGAWLYKRWDPQAKALVDMEAPPLTTTVLLQTLEELLQDVRTQEGLRKFHASRPLTQELANQVMDQEVCFSIQVALRGDVGQRMFQNLNKLCDNMVLKLLKSRMRPERNQRSGMAKLVEELLYG